MPPARFQHLWAHHAHTVEKGSINGAFRKKLHGFTPIGPKVFGLAVIVPKS